VAEPADTPSGKDDPQAPVEVVPYDPAWPGLFDEERGKIYDRLGTRIEDIEHVGSTAIEGLAAKPTIDILVGQPELAVDAEIVDGLASLSYRYLGEYGIPGRHFFRFVRPTEDPVLSPFCTSLTSITQEDVDRAKPFPEAFAEFLAWAGEGPHRFCSWGAYDLKQFLLDCARHGIKKPEWLEPHVNLRRMFSAEKNVPQCSMVQALEILDLPLEGTHHRGIDDARNIAKIAKFLL